MKQKQIEEVFFKRLLDIKHLHDKVKSAIILAENFDPKREYSVDVVNELRNALAHIFDAIVYDEKIIEDQMKSVESHIVRAGYDAYEILASNICIKISNTMNKYSSISISSLFPEYYSIIKKAITKIQVDIGDLRAKRKDIDLTFDTYLKNIEILINYQDQVNEMIPELEKYQSEETRKSIINWVVGGIIAIIIAIVSFVAGKYF